jgi:hypothetical protein
MSDGESSTEDSGAESAASVHTDPGRKPWGTLESQGQYQGRHKAYGKKRSNEAHDQATCCTPRRTSHCNYGGGTKARPSHEHGSSNNAASGHRGPFEGSMATDPEACVETPRGFREAAEACQQGGRVKGGATQGVQRRVHRRCQTASPAPGRSAESKRRPSGSTERSRIWSAERQHRAAAPSGSTDASGGFLGGTSTRTRRQFSKTFGAIVNAKDTATSVETRPFDQQHRNADRYTSRRGSEAEFTDCKETIEESVEESEDLFGDREAETAAPQAEHHRSSQGGGSIGSRSASVCAVSTRRSSRGAGSAGTTRTKKRQGEARNEGHGREGEFEESSRRRRNIGVAKNPSKVKSADDDKPTRQAQVRRRVRAKTSPAGPESESEATRPTEEGTAAHQGNQCRPARPATTTKRRKRGKAAAAPSIRGKMVAC